MFFVKQLSLESTSQEMLSLLQRASCHPDKSSIILEAAAPRALCDIRTYAVGRSDNLSSYYSSSKSSGYVVLGHLVIRLGEHLLCRVELDHFTNPKESGVIRDTRRLLHIVSHNHNRVFFL